MNEMSYAINTLRDMYEAEQQRALAAEATIEQVREVSLEQHLTWHNPSEAA